MGKEVHLHVYSFVYPFVHFVSIRPSYSDLPSASAPPVPRAELDALPSSDDSRFLGTREHLPSSDDTSRQPANQEEDYSIFSQSGERTDERRVSSTFRERANEGAFPAGRASSSQAPPPHPQAPPSVHRKAHRKTNRRKPSESSSSTQGRKSPVLKPHPKQGRRIAPEPRIPTRPTVQVPSDPKPWLSWQRERREAQKEEAFSDQRDLLDQTIERVCSYR